jgi:hypothetical protein
MKAPEPMAMPSPSTSRRICSHVSSGGFGTGANLSSKDGSALLIDRAAALTMPACMLSYSSWIMTMEFQIM